MFEFVTRPFLQATRFTSYTRPAPGIEQRLEKRQRTPSTDVQKGFRPPFWL